MNWNEIVSTRRTGEDSKRRGERTEYQRDFDRIIFSSGFRRLQNKTQVFPLPGTAFVHNRLTHSLEVASVGRSIGNIVGKKIVEDHPDMDEDHKNFYKHELSAVIASACLAHDIGNPAFGHSGEKAISNYFSENEEAEVEGKKLKDYFNPAEWGDLTNFEGNANALRILTNQFKGKSTGGLRLTYTTLASLLKYPCESIAMKKGQKHRSKYGFFQLEKETAQQIMEELNMIRESESPLIYKRHPFVYLTEAADDICYRIIDYEDAQRLGILSAKQVEDDFLALIAEISETKLQNTQKTLHTIEDKNERIAFLRAICINVLIMESARVFDLNSAAILAGSYGNALIDEVEEGSKALLKIRNTSQELIYNHDTVVEIEIAGYNVMSELLTLLIPPTLKAKPSAKDKKVLRLLPGQFEFDDEKDSPYRKVMSVLDYVSGMTDSYATELYRKIKGIETPKHK